MNTQVDTEAKFDRDWLRAAFDAAVDKLKAERLGRMLGEAFDSTADLVFETAYRALVQHDEGSGSSKMQVLSAKPGLGKSSYSNAVACAIASCGGAVLICCEQMESVDQRYRDLEKLMPGRVACYSSDHKKGNNNPTKVKNPAKQFHKEELFRYPVIITTHEGLKRDDDRLFRDWQASDSSYVAVARDLIIVDEMLKEVSQYAIDLATVEACTESLDTNPAAPKQATAGLYALRHFLRSRVGATADFRPPMDLMADQEAEAVRDRLAWFGTKDAEAFVAANPGMAPVFGYAACLHRGWAYTTTYGNETVLMGYSNGLPIGDVPMMQLDGTADICGLKALCLKDRDILLGPKVNYAGLQAIIEKPPTRQHLAKYLANVDNAVTYAEWLEGLVKKHAISGQKVLVVCKKALLGPTGGDGPALKVFPRWGRKSANWARINYTTDFGYVVEGRHVAVQWWGGPSTGHNAFQDAEVVILADAQWEPRHKVLADMQGYCRQAATDTGSPVDEMRKGLGSRPRRFEAYRLQALMASYVQAASRGTLRQWTPEGGCGSAKLVCALSETDWLFENWATMFPGAAKPILAIPPKQAKGKTNRSPRLGKAEPRVTAADKVKAFLSQPGIPFDIPWPFIERSTGVKWQTSKKELKGAMRTMTAVTGYRFVPGRGSLPPRMVKDNSTGHDF